MKLTGLPTLKNPIKSIGISIAANAISGLWDWLTGGSQWAIYYTGSTTNAINGLTSINALSVSGESRLSDYQFESGGFATYNKVPLPNTFPMRVIADGNLISRTQFIDSLEFLCKNVVKLDIKTPEKTYSSVTLISYRLDRTAEHGASMLTAEIIVRAVNEKPAQYTNSATATDLQSTPPTTSAQTFDTSATSSGGSIINDIF